MTGRISFVGKRTADDLARWPETVLAGGNAAGRVG
jgi:hypothetical protein